VERDVHELSAAYALDALDAEQAAAFEAHLAVCPACREDLASFRGTAGLLAFGAEAADPPPGLRERILAEARAERSNVVPLRRRIAFPAAATVAAAAACAAIGLGIWAASLSSQLDRERAANARVDEALAVAFDPDAEHFDVDGGDGVLAVGRGGQAALLLTGMEPAPEGRVYEAWVSADGERMLPAGTFQADDGTATVGLTRPVPDGGIVAVTLEPAGGSEEPSGTPLMVAETA
jgi:hypothetical protein